MRGPTTRTMKRGIIIAIMAAAIALVPAYGAKKARKTSGEKARQEQTGNTPGQSALELDEEALEIVNKILNGYTEWQSASFTGKLRTSMLKLPVSPTVRIYMEKGELIQLSVSAPFIGEVGRAEITPSEVLVVNKYKKTYVRESAEAAMSRDHGLLDQVQSLLLGRIVILGKGELSMGLLKDVQFERENNGEWIVVPNREGEESGLQYGYVVNANGRTQVLYGMMQGRTETATLTYDYAGGGMTLGLDLQLPKKRIEGQLDFSSVKWGGNRMSSINLDRYQKVTFSEFVTNYK